MSNRHEFSRYFVISPKTNGLLRRILTGSCVAILFFGPATNLLTGKRLYPESWDMFGRRNFDACKMEITATQNDLTSVSLDRFFLGSILPVFEDSDLHTRADSRQFVYSKVGAIRLLELVCQNANGITGVIGELRCRQMEYWGPVEKISLECRKK